MLMWPLVALTALSVSLYCIISRLAGMIPGWPFTGTFALIFGVLSRICFAISGFTLAKGFLLYLIR